MQEVINLNFIFSKNEIVSPRVRDLRISLVGIYIFIEAVREVDSRPSFRNRLQF